MQGTLAEHVKGKVNPDAPLLRLYIRTGIDNSRPQPAEATRTVTWHPLEQFFALAGQEAGNMLEPFVQPLAEWLENHFSECGFTPLPNMKWSQLRNILIWTKSTWQGPAPKQVLTAYCSLSKLPAACYELFEQPGSCYRGVCVLPWLGVQISPVACYESDQEAEQNAALHAILLVEGALNRNSPQAVITYVGFDPLRSGGLMSLAEAQQLVEGRHLRVQQQMDALRESFEAKQAALEAHDKMLTFQKAKLLEGGTKAEQVIGRLSASLSSQTRQRNAKRKRPESSNGLPPAKLAASDRNAIQVLKEMCDKHKWEMPDYQFMAVAGGAAGQRAHICHLHLPDAGLLDVASPACSSQKSAKSAAASLALTLIQKNKDAAAASMTD
eukprot:jgi/Astpho2/4527/Aster-x0649